MAGRLFKLLSVLMLVGACAWAWKSAGGSFVNLWLTPDQQGARLLAHQHYAEAAKHFHDPLWQGTALYRDGQFREASVAFARVDSPEAAFDHGNALLMHGKYSEAIASYDRALQRRPDWREAGLFAQLLDACRADDAKAAYNALLRWLDARHHGPDAATIAAFLAHHPDTDLRRQVEMLQESVLGRDTHRDGVALADGLRQARRHDLRRSRHTEEARLPDLNPR